MAARPRLVHRIPLCKLKSYTPSSRQNTRLAQQVTGAALPGQLEVLHGSRLASVLLICSSTLTYTGQSAHSTSQATVKSFRNRHVYWVELMKVSQRTLAGIIEMRHSYFLVEWLIKWQHTDLELHLTIIIIINEEESAKGAWDGISDRLWIVSYEYLDSVMSESNHLFSYV